MVGIRRHAAHAEEQQALQAADILLRVPQLAHVVRIEFAQGDGLGANAALEGGDGLGSKLTLLTQANMPSSISPSDSESPSAALCSGQGDQRPGQPSCSRAASAVLPHTPAAPVQAVHPRRLLALKQNMFPPVISRSSIKGCIFEVTALYCCVSYVSVVEPTGEANA